jgi:N-acetylneuraminate synthase
MQQLKTRYNVPVGFSDHSGNIFACLAAKCLGAEILEFHAVFDKRMFGPDTKSSLTLDEIAQLCIGLRDIDLALNSPIDKSDNKRFSGLKEIFEKSLSVNKSLPAGHILQESDLEAKKPKGYGIQANQYKNVIGKILSRDLIKWEFINQNDLLP